jgi:hypothetical protein
MQVGDTAYIRMEDSSLFWKGIVIKQSPSPIKNSPLFIIKEYNGDGRVAYHEDEFILKNNQYYEKVMSDGS